MRLVLAAALALLSGCAATTPPPPAEHHAHHAIPEPTGRIAVTIYDGAVEKVAFEAAPDRLLFGGGSVTIWADPGIRTPDGLRVAGYRFTAWMEGPRAKVAGWALVLPSGLEFSETTHQQILLDTWLGDIGTEVVVDEMRELGDEPVRLLFRDSVEAFAHDHSAHEH